MTPDPDDLYLGTVKTLYSIDFKRSTVIVVVAFPLRFSSIMCKCKALNMSLPLLISAATSITFTPGANLLSRLGWLRCNGLSLSRANTIGWFLRMGGLKRCLCVR